MTTAALNAHIEVKQDVWNPNVGDPKPSNSGPMAVCCLFVPVLQPLTVHRPSAQYRSRRCFLLTSIRGHTDMNAAGELANPSPEHRHQTCSSIRAWAISKTSLVLCSLVAVFPVERLSAMAVHPHFCLHFFLILHDIRTIPPVHPLSLTFASEHCNA